jgi:hypothetical protein
MDCFNVFMRRSQVGSSSEVDYGSSSEVESVHRAKSRCNSACYFFIIISTTLFSTTLEEVNGKSGVVDIGSSSEAAMQVALLLNILVSNLFSLPYPFKNLPPSPTYAIPSHF